MICVFSDCLFKIVRKSCPKVTVRKEAKNMLKITPQLTSIDKQKLVKHTVIYQEKRSQGGPTVPLTKTFLSVCQSQGLFFICFFFLREKMFLFQSCNSIWQFFRASFRLKVTERSDARFWSLSWIFQSVFFLSFVLFVIPIYIIIIIIYYLILFKCCVILCKKNTRFQYTFGLIWHR